jgi:hypothetical protein
MAAPQTMAWLFFQPPDVNNKAILQTKDPVALGHSDLTHPSIQLTS